MSDYRKYRYNREDMHSKHASYVKRKSEVGTKDRIDKNIMLLGENWYKIGHTLEDADPQLRTDASFICGYERAVRIDKINEDLYKLGVDYFKNGTPLHMIPRNYTESEFFIRGYNEALRLSLIEKNKRSRR